MMAKLRIALGDLTHLNLVNVHNYYTPLNIAFISAYCKVRFGSEVEISLYKDAARLLDDHRREAFDVVGLGAYYWRQELNRYVAGKVKAINRHTLVVVGGPSIDSDHATQERFLMLNPNYDAIIPNEGEVAFGNFVERLLGFLKAGRALETGPVDGLVIRMPDSGAIVRGAFINLSTDLARIPSPYLDGTLDPWLDGQWQPLLQTSRLCPYTCAFCVSGKDRGKLRAFPIEQVKAEIDYVVQNFRGPRDTLCYIVDENFGIMERDIAVADHLQRVQRERGFPNRIYFYNDKRFTHVARSVHERVGKMVWHGVCLSLQSENKDALKAASRRNLTDEQVVSAISWAKGMGFKTSTELIFGLPGETLESYCNTVDKCARMGFDVINSYNLILFDGIEMDRPRYREQHGIETFWRPIHGSATLFEDKAVVEREEVVVAANGFTKADFFEVRRLNVLLKAIYALGMERDFFDDLVRSGASLSRFLLDFAHTRHGNLTKTFGKDFDHIDLWHGHFTMRLRNVVLKNLYREQDWAERLALIRAGKLDPHKESNAFLPREAYEGGWFRPALERARRRWEEANGCSSPNGRPGATGALQPGAGR